eukprot:TRINITY_DN70983_c0_g1_i1.p1 TRINITY_DN70983_c0_g1~~TRINITY_DN70983_c0_g1_i1.p1  ORF type:complete len:430 (+),score=84.08 TRINITY_DN70983_c0_g1_i1:81-1370(+)
MGGAIKLATILLFTQVCGLGLVTGEHCDNADTANSTLCAASISAGAAASSTDVSAACEFRGTADIMEWVRASGGFVDERLALRSGPLGRGIFAQATIEQGDVIASVPLSLMIKEKRNPCKTVASLASELKLGKCSRHWPYLRMLRDVDADIPDAWSTDELALLDGLPPGDWRRHSKRYIDECARRFDDPFELRAMYLYVTRAGPLGMQPILDLFNHGFNSTKHRTITSSSMRSGKSGDKQGEDEATALHAITTQRRIEEGEEIFNQFRHGAGAGEAIALQTFERLVGAPELFSDYGFIERPPVLWWFRHHARKHRFIVTDEAGRVVLDPKLKDPLSLVQDGLEYLAMLEKRKKLYAEAGLHCSAAAISGRGNNAEIKRSRELLLPLRIDCSPSRVTRAMAYRDAFESALRCAVRVAQAQADTMANVRQS